MYLNNSNNNVKSNNFDNITIENFIEAFSKNCSKSIKKTFVKNESITSFIKKRNQICIVLEGHADLIRYDLYGNRSIVEHFSKHDIFGEAFYTITTNNELLVVAKTHCTVLFFTYEDIYNNNCHIRCDFHKTLKKFFPELVLKKITLLNERIELLTRAFNS